MDIGVIDILEVSLSYHSLNLITKLLHAQDCLDFSCANSTARTKGSLWPTASSNPLAPTIFTEIQIAEINIPLGTGIEAIDGPTVLYILYSTVSVQQTIFLPQNASQMTPVLPKVYVAYVRPPSQCLSSYGCAISIVYCAMSS